MVAVDTDFKNDRQVFSLGTTTTGRYYCVCVAKKYYSVFKIEKFDMIIQQISGLKKKTYKFDFYDNF